MARIAVALVALSVAAANPVSAQSADAPPIQPDNFRATLYDKAGGELFWERSTDDRGAVRGYEITRNGRSLGIRDALSFYDPSLQPDTPYTSTVVAIDNAGQRSSVARTMLGGGTTPAPPSGGPEAPDELRSDVYSKRSAELFWKREPAELALRYEIRRDGEVVGTTDGVSYYTRDLAAGTDYAFEVVAIGRDGGRSAPSSIAVRTDGDDPSTTPAADGPRPPAELTAKVQSERAVRLEWRREQAELDFRYEIRRDGQVIDTIGPDIGFVYGFSTNTLVAGTDYVFEVIAIDTDGRRSAPSRIEVRTDGERPPPESVPAAPENPRVEVYRPVPGMPRQAALF